MDTPEGRGTVVELDLLRQRVKVRMEDNPETVSAFANADIAVLRSGKAKKNDPPIPADLAPISGNGKRVRKEETEQAMVLEPIRFRYSTESVVTETEEETEQQKPAANRRRRKPQNDSSKEQKPEQPPKQEKPRQKPESAAEAENQERPEKKPSRRRPNYRRRKPKTQGGGQETT